MSLDAIKEATANLILKSSSEPHHDIYSLIVC